MGFTKLDSGIVDSSIWAEPLATRVVWVTFLAKSNYHGIVKASRSGMLRSSNVMEKDFNEAIQTLESPDSDSRSPEFDGRRIQKIEGGWQILNYQRYREFSYSDSPSAIRQRRHREERRDRSLHVTKGCDISASASASESSSLSLTKNIEEIKGGWNEFAAKHNLATITKIDPKSERGRHLAARMAEKEWDFPKLLEVVAESPFLIGKKGKEPFFVTLDWLLWPGNYQRTMEGNYRERKRKESFWGEGDSDKD